jgi:hypothetical protein
MEAIGHDSELRNRPLEFEDSEQTCSAQNRQTVRCVIPEVGIVCQFLEWTKEHTGMLCRVLEP